MTGRAIIRGGSTAAVQVSLPGHEVQTASLNDMAFDARFANLQVLHRATFNMPEIYAQNTQYGQAVYYPEVVSKPPLCFVRVRQNAGRVFPAQAFDTSFVFGDGVAGTLGFFANVYTDHADFYVISTNPRESDSFLSPTTWNVMFLRPLI